MTSPIPLDELPARMRLLADGPRYKMCGNGFTSTVIRWIGERIEIAHGYSAVRAAA